MNIYTSVLYLRRALESLHGQCEFRSKAIWKLEK